MIFIAPSASAASVPGRGWMCQSAIMVVRVTRGSITTSCTPRSCASRMNGIACTPVLTRFAPHSTIRSASCAASESAGPLATP